MYPPRQDNWHCLPTFAKSASSGRFGKCWQAMSAVLTFGVHAINWVSLVPYSSVQHWNFLYAHWKLSLCSSKIATFSPKIATYWRIAIAFQNRPFLGGESPRNSGATGPFKTATLARNRHNWKPWKQLTLFSFNLSATANFVMIVTKLIKNSWLCFVCHQTYQKQLTLFCLSLNLSETADFV